MKYSEFRQLDEILSTTDINEFEDVLLEADKTTDAGQLDTKRGNWFSRWGLMKNKLNKAAKRIQDQIIQKIVEKYLPTILETERNAAIQLGELIKQNKQPKQIMELMTQNMNTVAALQKQQIKTIYAHIDKMVQNSSVKFDAKIEKSKMNDKNKLNIKNYWLMLTTQIKMNAFQHISQAIQNEVVAVVGDHGFKYFNAFDPTLKTVKETYGTYKEKAEAEKANADATESDLAGSGASDTETMPVVNKEYVYTTSKGIQQVVTITKITDDGIEVQPATGAAPYSVKKDRANKFVASVPEKSAVKREVPISA